MGCFSLYWIENLLIWLVVLGAVWAVVKLLLPLILGPLGAYGAVVAQVLGIVVWVIVAVALIIVVFDLLACALPFRGVRSP